MTLSFNKNYITVFGVITCAIFVLIGYQNGIFSSPESLKVFLSNLGIFAPLGFILFQIIQQEWISNAIPVHATIPFQ